MIIQSAPHFRVHCNKTNSHRFWQLLDTTFCRDLMWLDQFHISTVQLELFWSLWMVSKSTTKRMHFFHLKKKKKHRFVNMGCLPSTGEFAMDFATFISRFFRSAPWSAAISATNRRPTPNEARSHRRQTQLGFLWRNSHTIYIYNGILTIYRYNKII